MINVKDQVFAKLKTVTTNVSDVYPYSWEVMPAIQYTEEANEVRLRTDNSEQTSYIRFRIDIWNTGSTSQLALQVDEAISELGLVRTACQDVEDPTRNRHKLLRYEGIIDNRTQVVYWDR